MRHAHVDIGEGMGHLSPGKCAAEVNLSAHGIEQARRIGEAFRAHGIQIGAVLTSPFCRNVNTGMLAFGRAFVVPFLAPPGVVSESQARTNHELAIRTIRQQGGRLNTVMITHDLNVLDIALESILPGEFLVLEPTGADFEVIGKIGIDVP